MQGLTTHGTVLIAALALFSLMAIPQSPKDVTEFAGTVVNEAGIPVPNIEVLVSDRKDFNVIFRSEKDGQIYGSFAGYHLQDAVLEVFVREKGKTEKAGEIEKVKKINWLKVIKHPEGYTSFVDDNSAR